MKSPPALRSKWPGADKLIAKKRPKSIIGTPQERLLPKPIPPVVEVSTPPIQGIPITKPVTPIKKVVKKKAPTKKPIKKVSIKKPKPQVIEKPIAVDIQQQVTKEDVLKFLSSKIQTTQELKLKIKLAGKTDKNFVLFKHINQLVEEKKIIVGLKGIKRIGVVPEVKKSVKVIKVKPTISESLSSKGKTVIDILVETGESSIIKVRRELKELVKQGKAIRTGTKYQLKSVKRLKSQSAWEKSLTDSERLAIKLYTGDTYTLVRNCQRLNKNCSKEVLELIKNLESLMAKAPQFKKSTFRGLSFSKESERTRFIAEIKKSKGIVDNGFVSTSKNRDVAASFASDDAFGVLMEIKGKSGIDIQKLSGIAKEEEVLFGRGIKFEFKGLKKGPRNNIIMVMEEI